MNKVEEIIAATKLSELMNKKEEDKNCKRSEEHTSELQSQR